MAKDDGRSEGLRVQVECEVAAYAREDARVGQLVRDEKLDQLVQHIKSWLRLSRDDAVVGRQAELLRGIVRWACGNWVRKDCEERVQAECAAARIRRDKVGSSDVVENPDDDRATDRAAKKWLKRRQREIDDDLLGWRPRRVGRA